MIEVGNERKAYLTNETFASSTWIEGEESNSLQQSCEVGEVFGGSTSWGRFISRKKTATANVSVHLDNTATSAQHKLLQSFTEGSKVFCYLGKMKYNRPCSGDFFTGVITAINDANSQDTVARRDISIQVCGDLQHYPPYDGGIFVLGVSQLGGSDILW